MTTATRTAETANYTVVVKLTREVVEKNSFSDGWNVSLGKETKEYYEVKMTLKANGKGVSMMGKPGNFAFLQVVEGSKGIPAGAYARLSDAYMSKATYDLVMGLIAELDAEVAKSDEFVAIETDAAERKAKLEAWRNSPEGKAELAAADRHNRLMREMNKANSDY